ncbi:PREDICTED: Retrovirus-related Pol poly from, partial [Prunus dulcis]
FATSVKKFGYVQSNSDHTLFLKRRKDKLIALIIYVDDMIVTGDDQTEIQSLHKYMASEFEMKSL